MSEKYQVEKVISPAVFADLYQALAQFFAAKSMHDLPGWLVLAGVKWPIFENMVLLAQEMAIDPYHQAVQASLSVSPQPLHSVWGEYQPFFNDKHSWLYESKHVDGRIPGPATFTISHLYQQAGLENTSAELSDHISLELVFLGHLAEKELSNAAEAQMWRTARKLFIKKHARKWMPDVGRLLRQSQSPRLQVMGMLLTGLTSEIKPIKNVAISQYPSMQAAAQCTLCGFCVRVCPTQSMQVAEAGNTAQLYFDLSRCVACGRCAEICPSHMLELGAVDESEKQQLLFKSPRTCCSKCDAYTVSEAELAFTKKMLGEQAWLDLCNACKSELNGVIK